MTLKDYSEYPCACNFYNIYIIILLIQYYVVQTSEHSRARSMACIEFTIISIRSLSAVMWRRSFVKYPVYRAIQ